MQSERLRKEIKTPNPQIRKEVPKQVKKNKQKKIKGAKDEAH